MFPTIDVDLVRDVLHNVQGNSEKACHQLLVIQVFPAYSQGPAVVVSVYKGSIMAQLLRAVCNRECGWCCL